MNVNTAVINGKNYVEVDCIEVKGIKYAYLVNEEDNFDFTIRRIVEEADKVFYDPLKDEVEFDTALMYFLKKHREDKTKEEY